VGETGSIPTVNRSALRDIDIGPVARTDDAALQGDVISVAAGGNMAAFDRALSRRHQQDVAESLLLAQLGASTKSDRQLDPESWMREYLSVLGRISWVVTTAYTSSRYLPQVAAYDAAALVLDMFRKRLPEAITPVRSLIGAHRSDEGAAQVLFECPAHSGGLANYQVAFASENDAHVGVGRVARASVLTAAPAQ
jgi:hypothetical protein